MTLDRNEAAVKALLKNCDSLTPEILILIGISAGTGLATGVVDAGKRQQRMTLEQERASMAPRLNASQAAISAAATPAEGAEPSAELQQKRTRIAEINARVVALPSPIGPSQFFLLYILRDETGISFHRFQMVAWNIILGFVLVSRVLPS